MSSDLLKSTLSNNEVKSPIHLLLLEDVPEDIELILLALTNADLEFTYDTAETASLYTLKLEENRYDAVLADYRLPGFNGLQALKILQQSGQKIPFILVTGSLGEEAAVACMKAGITDYLLKDRLFRLPNILQRSLEEFALRRQQQQALLEQQKAEKALRDSEKRFRSLIENAIDIILIVSSAGEFRYVSPSVKRILGYSPNRLKDQPLFDLIHPEDQQRIKSFFNRIKNTTNQSIPISEFRVRTHDNNWVMLDAIAKNLEDDPAIAGFVINCHDITERHHTAQQLRYDAYHDKLTGLANRTALLHELEHAIIQHQRRKDDHFALLFLDLDRFKVINDSLGHLTGDQLLQEMAKRLQQCHRQGDMLARFGGDEFVFLLRDIREMQEAVVVAERIHQVLQPPLMLNNREIFMSASIGITISGEHYHHPEQMLRDADAAMYRAKAKGRACHEIFVSTMHLSALKELHLENDLRQALQRQELVVYYQPIFDLETEKIVGAEALVRWHPPGKSLIPPNDFIPLAEETGLIIEIDRWVLKCACQQLYQWQQTFQKFAPHFISVNLSPKQFSDASLKDKITEIVDKTGLERQHLKLEITETVFLKNSHAVLGILSELQELNIQICLDDFGTGYSSLSYLHRFPLNSFKIDRSFVIHLGQTNKNDAIVRIVGTLAHELQLELIAEGVEEGYQIEALKKLGYQWGQGYYFSPPIDAQAFTLLLEKNRYHVVEKI
ncbi:putative bifunctional diguanylate cyclase/phosphodiesterase [Crocosphaera sp.]|uniref:putative bifunctional diguanylate cyclase/phosphodiesterase n=1 Tax=Crocosphaera sp. TaxID=2729996 RepID=UPI003F1F470D|nr:EAL domain-containing protein [Crocosphaera sp.]